MRAAFIFFVSFALASCERRPQPAPADEAPRPTASPGADAPTAAAEPPSQREQPAPRPEDLRVVLGTEASLGAPGSSATNVARRPWAGPIDQMLAQDAPDPIFLSHNPLPSP